jgi:DNA ligase 1
LKHGLYFILNRTPYLALAKTFEAIETHNSRLKMIEILSNFFRSVIVLNPKDLMPSIYLCLNQVAPAFEGLELGVAETNIMKAIAQTTGRSLQQIKHGENLKFKFIFLFKNMIQQMLN